ncbi:Lacal_2735 family protein [Cochleicola gelatinilyticus]|uniref:Lacal_2735 family protein n=1 Tax=Cochleicola gelatinilyticus TaxID=1763537 RepID=UPI0012FA2066|nr:Lacal_2735 family protein [Cochleicola gelatinilyticus]
MWFKKRTRLDILKKKYQELMRKSYEVALNDEEKSDRLNKQAQKIFDEIRYMSMKYADK